VESIANDLFIFVGIADNDILPAAMVRLDYDSFILPQNLMKPLAAASFIFTSVFLFACTQDPGGAHNASTPAPPPATPQPVATLEPVAAGRKVYEMSCMNCHKPDGSGGRVTIDGTTVNADNLASAKIKGFSDEKIRGYIVNGIKDEGMPAFKDTLSEAEITNVIRYIRAEFHKMP
jgi:mono/diheme cytochrome c family protein